jgi:hypothetical protein
MENYDNDALARYLARASLNRAYREARARRLRYRAWDRVWCALLGVKYR